MNLKHRPEHDSSVLLEAEDEKFQACAPARARGKLQAELKEELICGVDPGKTGGIVILRTSKKGDHFEYEVVEGWPMPEDGDSEIVSLLNEICSRVSVVYIEQVPKFAGENRSAAFMAVLFGNYRLIAGAAMTHALLRGKDSLRVVEMPLLLWMNQIIPGKMRSRDRATRKKQLKAKAELFWPTWKWTLATCDAPLIAMAGHSLGR